MVYRSCRSIKLSAISNLQIEEETCWLADAAGEGEIAADIAPDAEAVTDMLFACCEADAIEELEPADADIETEADADIETEADAEMDCVCC